MRVCTDTYFRILEYVLKYVCTYLYPCLPASALHVRMRAANEISAPGVEVVRVDYGLDTSSKIQICVEQTVCKVGHFLAGLALQCFGIILKYMGLVLGLLGSFLGY